MSIFDAIASQFKKQSTQTGAGLFDVISKYFAPTAGGVRIRDIAREIPGSFSDILGKPSLRAFGGVTSYLTGKPFTPTGQFQQDLYGTDKPITLQSVGQELRGGIGGDKPRGIDPALGLFAGLADAIPGGSVAKKGAKALTELAVEISKTKKATEIFSLLKSKFSGVADDTIRTLSETLAPITDSKQAEKLIADNILNTRERGFVTSVKESPTTAPEVRAGLNERYTPITNRETLAQATKIVDSSIDEAYRIAKSTKAPTALENTVSQILIKRLQDEATLLKSTDIAKSNKLYDDVVDIVENTARRATTQGQAIQSLSMFSRLTPEGILIYAQRQINKANDIIKIPSNKIKLTPELATTLRAGIDKIQKLPEGRDKIVETAVLLKELQDIIPASVLKKIATTQTIFQLLNPKTTIRNIVGNLGFAVAENISDVVGVGLDSALSLITGKRSKAFPSLKVQLASGKVGFRQGLQDALLGIDTSKAGTQFDLPKTQVFSNPVGQGAQKLLDIVLKVPDRAAFQAAYDGSLYQQMKAAGVDTPTEVMKEVAHFDGLYRTFQDENATTYVFQTIKKGLNAGKEFGVGDFVLKYPKTPANLLNRGLAYSPMGFVNTVLELAKPLVGRGPFNQKKFIESTSRALVGSAMVYGTGSILHRVGIITTERDPNKDVSQAQRETGLGQYKLNISALKRYALGGFDDGLAKLQKGDTLISYDWFQPLAIPLALGADFDKNKGDNLSMLSTLVSGVASGANTLAEQPLVSGLTTPLKFGNLGDAGTRVLQSIPSSFVPTLFNQIKQLKDNTARNTYDPDTITYAINLAKNRIPGLSETLPPLYGSFGQTQGVYQGGTNNLFNVLFNPSFVTKYKPTPEAKMVLDIYYDSGEKKQLPNIVAKTQVVNGKSRKLTAKEVTNLQRYAGTTTREIFSRLAGSPQFIALPDDEKAKALSGIISDIGSAAKIIFLGERPKKNPGNTTLGLVSAFFENNKTRIEDQQGNR